MDTIRRRDAIKTLGAAGAGALFVFRPGSATDGDDGGAHAQEGTFTVAGRPVEIVVESISAKTVRISVVPVDRGRPSPAIPLDGSLVRASWSQPRARLTTVTSEGARVQVGALTAIVSRDPLGVRIEAPDAAGDAAASASVSASASGSQSGAVSGAAAAATAAGSRSKPSSSPSGASKARVVQELRIDAATGAVTFPLGDGPVLGFGQGGPQFDRRGMTDRMRSGQGAYRLRTHGGRVPVPWLIGTSGWAMFIHQPFGLFDLSGSEGRFVPAIQGARTPAPPTPATSPGQTTPTAAAPASASGATGASGGASGTGAASGTASGTAGSSQPPPPAPASAPLPPPNPAAALPLDIFIVASREPAEVMAEWARLTGSPEMPPRWTLGYQQSHRTLAGRDEIVGVAQTFRDKKLPCDALIYLGTGFTPSGWNAANGSFAFNRAVFDDPKAVLDDLHARHFKVVLHSVILARALRGVVAERCDLSRYDEEQVGCYWQTHRKTFALGVDGWWPDEGDPLDIASRLTRNRMYWEGPQIDRPDERPYALHRNGYAGMQRYASFLWSGDTFSTWETLKTHVPIAINTGLTGIPYWGTDIGGFVPTKELTGELYVRWFQFGAFCPLFRSHGRTWKLRLPWGWNTGDLSPNEVTATYSGDAGNPDEKELHNADVEPICRKFLELRYRLMPYLYSVVHEGTRTGLPIVRALWLHHADDPAAVARGDEYLWGRDLLVAPVTERGATSRRLYLPRGRWYDFWTEEAIDGGREIDRAVDLATMPLYARAGGIIATGPVKQYTDEAVAGPLTLTVYPGADGECLVYDDDGRSFAHRTGAWTGLEVAWRDAARTLTVRLAKGSRLLPPGNRPLLVRLAGTQTTREATFEGRELTVTMS